MEKQHHHQQQQQEAPKAKNKFLKLLPKAASAVYFRNPPFSPGRDKRLSEIHQHIHRVKPHHVGKGYSGPIVSIIPDEVRRRTTKNGSFENQEPTSPKISCMGQIKHKKKIIKKQAANNNKKNNQETKPEKSSNTSTSIPRHEIKKQALTIKRLFSSAVKVPEHGRRRSDADAPICDKQQQTDTSHRAPTLSQMRRFASGRDTFANFDWKSQVAPVESDSRNYYSDEDEEQHSDQEDDREMIIPFSAPIIVGPVVGNLQPRKEINLWQRRTMNPPNPLQLNATVRTI